MLDTSFAAAMPQMLTHYTLDLWRLWARGINRMGVLTFQGQATGEPATELRIIEEAASYGTQLARIAAALEVLLRRAGLNADSPGLSDEERKALRELAEMRQMVNSVKRKARVSLPAPRPATAAPALAKANPAPPVTKRSEVAPRPPARPRRQLARAR